MELQAALAAAAPGDTLRVPAGRYSVNLFIDRPVTLLAVGQVVLDGAQRGSVVRVDAAAGPVRLVGLTLVGGTADEAGGGLHVADGQVDLEDCTLRFNKAPQYGGGGLFVGGGQVTATRCRIEANTGRQGGGVLVDGTGALVLRDSTVIQNAAVDGGGLRVKEGASATLVGCTVADNKVLGEAARGGAVSLAGSSTRRPSLELRHSVVSERQPGPACVFNASPFPGALSLVNNVLPPWCAALGGDNRFAAAGFTGAGAEPYLLSDDSPARGLGVAGELGAKDVRGAPRDTPPSLGAFAWVKASSTPLPY